MARASWTTSQRPSSRRTGPGPPPAHHCHPSHTSYSSTKTIVRPTLCSSIPSVQPYKNTNHRPGFLRCFFNSNAAISRNDNRFFISQIWRFQVSPGHPPSEMMCPGSRPSGHWSDPPDPGHREGLGGSCSRPPSCAAANDPRSFVPHHRLSPPPPARWPSPPSPPSLNAPAPASTDPSPSLAHGTHRRPPSPTLCTCCGGGPAVGRWNRVDRLRDLA